MVDAWKALGSPEPPTREETAELRLAARATGSETRRADAEGRLALELLLQPWTVVSLRQR